MRAIVAVPVIIVRNGESMKKFIAIALAICVFQYWDTIHSVFAGGPEHQAASDRVVLYATEWCGYCDKTRELFAEHRISYVEIDIEKSAQGHQEYERLGGRGVPVVNAYGTVIHGYAPRQILDAAKRN